MSSRLKLLQILFFIWTGVIVLRLGYWQIIKSPGLKDEAAFQHTSSVTLPASRGQIFASDGFPLVANQDSYLFYINPREIDRDYKRLNELKSLLSASESARLDQALDATDLSWVAVSHYLPSPLKQAISALKLAGIGFEPEPTRLYPEGSGSAYITGFVGKDELGQPKGYFGLEGYYDRLLSGRPGKIVQERDALNRPIIIGSFNKIFPQNGGDLTTSIDRTVQYLATTKLAAGLEKYQAASGTVTIMESSTGRILAMTSLPGYDPANFTAYLPQLYKNPIVSEGYEPGSTFKPLIMSAAIDVGAVTPDTICDICSGPVFLSGERVGSWNDKYYAGSTMTDVILHSDNVGMVFVSRKLGEKRMLEYLDKFGFGKLTGIEMQEENAPEIRPADQWYEIDLGAAAFGQGIAVTRLQMVTAMNAIANKGRLIPPRLVTQITTGRQQKTFSPISSTQVVSLASAVKVTEMMVNGVEKGEVRYYKPSGFLIAGKTGTAQVPISGHYDKDKFIASFIGFAPADNPKFTMLVTLREPKTSPWGSTTAAPLWFDIARELFRYYKIAPKAN